MALKKLILKCSRLTNVIFIQITKLFLLFFIFWGHLPYNPVGEWEYILQELVCKLNTKDSGLWALKKYILSLTQNRWNEQPYQWTQDIVTGVYIVQFDHFPAPPLFWDHFFSPTNKFAAAGVSEDPPAKIFGVFDPKRCIFNAFFPILQGYILCNSIIFRPPPLFWDHFFPPTNKFAAGGAKFMTQKDAFLRPFPPFLM